MGYRDEVLLHQRKCRQHLARAKLALTLGTASVASGALAHETPLAELALGPGDQTLARVEEALTKSLFLDLKVNFELFLWTQCRAWLRWDFVSAMRRLNDSQHKNAVLRNYLKSKAFSDVFSDDVEEFLPSHGLDLLWALLSGMTPGGLGFPIDAQIHAAFAVRHAVEHRNGRADQKFVSQCHRLWSGTTWSDVELRVDALVPVRPKDFAATYESMDVRTQEIAKRLIMVATRSELS